MIGATCLLAAVHSHNLSILGVVILIDAMIVEGLLADFESLFVESTPYSEPSLIVQGFVASRELDLAVFSMKASVFVHLLGVSIGLDENFVAGNGHEPKSLSDVSLVAFVDVELGGIAIDLIQPVPTHSGTHGSFVVASDTPFPFNCLVLPVVAFFPVQFETKAILPPVGN